ncbi:Hypothetical protein GLP15_2337 [Giardia lamblia P15]|uniref:Uncharacterized protein n=1 Tax=Giardia intestinalis (strain P15) TaxID=658858 RepID=E1F191_GIAIA|nr:Hypothetical protein GLP15_2337 [Giardia lamblia P15]
MTVSSTVDRCIGLFEDDPLQSLGLSHQTTNPDTTARAVDLLEIRKTPELLLTDDQIRAAVRVKKRCSVAGCNRITMPLATVCKYHLAGSSAAVFGSCGYPGCTAPVANMKILGMDHDALCPLHASVPLLQNSDERQQNANRFFQKQLGPGNGQLDALIMGTCDELVRHYARDRDLFSVFSYPFEALETSICCNEMATRVVPVNKEHATACVESMVSQIQYLCAGLQLEE